MPVASPSSSPAFAGGMTHRCSLPSFLSILLVFFFRPVNSGLTDRDADILLLAKAAHLDDPNGRIHDWVPSNSPCNWTGVTCGPASGAPISIDLSGAGISGGFPTGFCRVPTLQRLSLGDNLLGAALSAAALSPCSRLHYLNVSNNLFGGVLPELSPPLRDLRVLDFSRNNFSGEIPASFGVLPSLRVLNLYGNYLAGRIPPFLGNLSELEQFNLAYNTFEGPLPPEIGNLTKLVNLWLPSSNLAGEIPETVGNLVRLTNLDLSNNMLTGRIPGSVGKMRSLVQIELYGNRLSGELPASLGNLTSLLRFDASENGLTGGLPEAFAGLPLTSLGLNDNFLQGEIPRTLAANPNLLSLKLFNNSFFGELPADLGRNSDLETLDVSTNRLVGGLPKDLCKRRKLQELIAFNNKLSGELPATYGDCRSLSYIRIFNNELAGKVPEGVWGLPELHHMGIGSNHFEGPLPPAIYQAQKLSQLLISDNKFSGELPAEICELQNLTNMIAGSNQFSGEVPPCIGQLRSLQKLELQDNMFTGCVPVGSWPVLMELNLSRNRFSGQIPGSLADLPVLTYLDLSENNLSGEIPQRLADLTLNCFNLSNNDLAGRIPAGFATAFFLPSLKGNAKLCTDSDLPPVRPCSSPVRNVLSRPKTVVLLSMVALFVAAGVALLSGFLWIHMIGGKRKTAKGWKPKRPWQLISFHGAGGFDEEEILGSMTEANLIGTGRSGQVYRVQLKTGRTVAVKRLWGGPREVEAEREFRAEVETLGRLLHSNVVRLLCCCAAAEGMRALVYEYMENGSLEGVLHGEKGGALLGWRRRAGVAVGAAQGLAYLNHDCVPPVVHRDVKSSNILLDGEFRARVADFGLARVLRRRRREPSGGGEEAGAWAVSQVAGSCGYIAPEYAYTLNVNEKSDVYSFGVVLLELVTGRRAVDDVAFGENRDLVRWVADAVAAAEGVSKDGQAARLRSLLDPRLNPPPEECESMLKVLDVGLLCTSALPTKRPSMRRVVELLRAATTWASATVPSAQWKL